MRSSELIRKLQELDPTGETEVCIDNHDIYFVDRMPVYYDGPLEILERDAEGHCVSARYLQQSSELFKLKIKVRSINDCIAQDVDFPVDYSDLNERCQVELKESHDKWRKSVQRVEEELDLQCFYAWVEDRSGDKFISGSVRPFFQEHKELLRKIPDDIKTCRLSEFDQRWITFDRLVEITKVNKFSVRLSMKD